MADNCKTKAPKRNWQMLLSLGIGIFEANLKNKVMLNDKWGRSTLLEIIQA